MSKEQSHQHAVERILEDESLTADLIDPAARLLIDWAVAQAEIILTEEEAPEKQEVCMAALRRTMKRISQTAGQGPPTEQLDRVQALLDATQRLEAESDEQS